MRYAGTDRGGPRGPLTRTGGGGRTIVIHRLIAALRRAHGIAWALWLVGAGCTSLREIPRGDYGVLAERKDVRLVTREGLKYEFDYVHIEGDTLVGYRRRDVEGPIDEFGTVRLALDDVGQLEARRIDWKRTGIIGAGAAVAVAAAGVVRNQGNGGGSGSGGTKNPVP